MNLLYKPISVSLAPNSEIDDVFLALKVFINVPKWKKGQNLEVIRTDFKRRYNTDYVTTYNAGRSAFYLLLKSFEIGPDDEVMIQAFTCVAVPNCVIWNGAKPVYVDIDSTLNFDVVDARKKITPKTKAIVVQHTFGVPADMGAIMHFASENHLLVFEDCAHSFGVSYENTFLGAFGDGAFFSFGRDKVISSVSGGLAIINKRHIAAGRRLQDLHNSLEYPENFWIFQQLFHVIVFPIILFLYNVYIGKLVLYLLQAFGLLSVPIDRMEKHGERPSIYPLKYPNALAVLAVHQINKLSKFAINRQYAGKQYRKYLTSLKNLSQFNSRGIPTYLRFPLGTQFSNRIVSMMKSRNIMVGNWYHKVIDPTDVSLSSIGYVKGSCPAAEKIAGRVINLPTNINKDVVASVIKSLAETDQELA